MIAAVDVETTGINLLGGCRLFSIATCDTQGNTWFVDFPVDPTTRQPIITDKNRKKVKQHLEKISKYVFFNAKFDIRALLFFDPTLANLFTYDRIEDVASSAHILNSGDEIALKSLSHKYLGNDRRDEKDLKEATRKARAFARKHHPQWLLADDDKKECDYWLVKHLDKKSKLNEKYNVQDVIDTIQLWMMYENEISGIAVPTQKGIRSLKSLYRSEINLIPVVDRVERKGFRLLTKRLKEDRIKYQNEINVDERECIQIAAQKGMKDFNIRSGPQMQKLLYEKFQLPVMGRTKPSKK